MTYSKDSKQKLTAIAAVVIVALLGLNAFLLYNSHQQKEENKEVASKLLEAERMEAEVQKQYYEALAELDAMKGNEENLNALIDEQKEKLIEQKNKLASGIRTKKDLAAAKKQLAELRVQVDQFVMEINTLKDENAQLAQANVQLSEEKTTLQGEVSKERMMNEELVSAKTVLISEKEALQTEKEGLSKTVFLASAIRVDNVKVTGYKQRSNKAVERKKAKNVDHLRVCFNATRNEVAKGGLEQFFVRIINPIGETLAIEDLGSGTTTNSKTGEEIRYTHIQEVDYSNEEMEACFLWKPNVPFAKGKYEVEIFNKGFLTGTGTFELK